MTDTGTTFRRQKMDDARRQTFLAALRESGSYGHAARVASPMSKHANGCIASFRAEQRRNPEFAEAIEEAQAEADAALLVEARRRAITGWQEAVFQKGQRVYDVDPKTGEAVPATIRRYSDTMLAILLKGRMKEFNEKFIHQTVSGQIDHSVNLAQPGLVIYRSELPWLTSEQRRVLAQVCLKLAQVRGDAPPDTEQIELKDITPEPVAIEAIQYDPWEVTAA